MVSCTRFIIFQTTHLLDSHSLSRVYSSNLLYCNNNPMRACASLLFTSVLLQFDMFINYFDSHEPMRSQIKSLANIVTLSILYIQPIAPVSAVNPKLKFPSNCKIRGKHRKKFVFSCKMLLLF